MYTYVDRYMYTGTPQTLRPRKNHNHFSRIDCGFCWDPNPHRGAPLTPNSEGAVLTPPLLERARRRGVGGD